eukprot:gene10364-biopygen4929
MQPMAAKAIVMKDNLQESARGHILAALQQLKEGGQPGHVTAPAPTANKGGVLQGILHNVGIESPAERKSEGKSEVSSPAVSPGTSSGAGGVGVDPVVLRMLPWSCLNCLPSSQLNC